MAHGSRNQLGPRDPDQARADYERLSPEERIEALIARDASIRLLKELRREAVEEGITDPLTGVLNRRGFGRAFGQGRARAGRNAGGKPDLLALVDLDQFKELNDTAGHAAGDAALVRVAEVLQESVRGGDVVARMGGDEFAALLFGATAKEGVIAGERMLDYVALSRERDPDTIVPGLSIGLAVIDYTQPFQVTYEQADAALYRSKEAGRNQVSVAALPEQPAS